MAYTFQQLLRSRSSPLSPSPAVCWVSSVTVIGVDSSTYTLEINAYDSNMTPSQEIVDDAFIAPGAVDSYIIEYSTVPGKNVVRVMMKH